MNLAFGLAFTFMGIVHLLPGVGQVVAERYVRTWGGGGARYRWFLGWAFLVLGLNWLAQAVGLPSVRLFGG